MPGWDGVVFVGEVEAFGLPGFDPVRYDEPCRKVIAADETLTTRMLFAIGDMHGSGASLYLSIGDRLAYDYGAIAEGGFWDTYSNQVTLRIPSGAAPMKGRRSPPTLDASAVPPLRTRASVVTLSGLAHDSDGIAHLVVFADDDKVFLDVSDPEVAAIQTIPYTATVRLEPGSHRLTVIATDVHGLTRTQSHRVFVEEPEPQASR